MGTNPRWQKLELGDLVVVAYWGLLVTTLAVLTSWPFEIAAELRLTTGLRKALFLFVMWLVAVAFFQTALGGWGIVKSAWRFLLSPLTALRLAYGFLRDSNRLFKKLKERLPTRILFWGSLPVALLVALGETNPDLLRITRAVIVFQLVLMLWSCFRWTLNPVRFLERLKPLENAATKAQIVQGLVKVETPDEKEGKTKLLERIKQLQFGLQAAQKILQWLSGPRLLFSIFAFVCVVAGSFAIFALGGLLRIENVLAGGSAFGGPFFTGHWSDYVYISALQFVGSDLHGIEILSPSVKYLLVALPYVAWSLLGFLVLAFSTVAQSRTEKAFGNLGKGVADLIAEAAKSISERPEVFLVEKKDKAPSSPEAPPSVPRVQVNSKPADGKPEISH